MFCQLDPYSVGFSSETVVANRQVKGELLSYKGSAPWWFWACFPSNLSLTSKTWFVGIFWNQWHSNVDSRHTVLILGSLGAWLSSPESLNIAWRSKHRFSAKLWHKNDVFDDIWWVGVPNIAQKQPCTHHMIPVCNCWILFTEISRKEQLLGIGKGLSTLHAPYTFNSINPVLGDGLGERQWLVMCRGGYRGGTLRKCPIQSYPPTKKM